MNANDKKELTKRRKQTAKEARQYHKEQEKMTKSSEKRAKSKKQKTKKDNTKKPKTNSSSKIKEAVNSGKAAKYENISREEKFRREGKKKIRNLRPQDFEDGYYIDEYGEKQRQERRAREIRKQEAEVIKRSKKPLTQKQIRIKRILISSAIFLVVIVIGIILSLTVLFKTEKIEIEGGETYYYEDQIIAFSNVSLQQNIFIAAMGGTPEKISENLPYVEKAQIGFSIPDTVTIKITEAVPTYVIKDGNSFLVVSSKGRILESASANSKNLTELICADLASKKPGDYIKFTDANISEILETVANSLKEHKVNKITAFNVADTANIMLNYDNHIMINLGLPEDIDYKIKTAITIIKEKLDPNNTGAIYGTLDVSTCVKNKMSHYKPAETIPTTEPPTTEPETTTANSYDYSSGGYDYSGGTYDDSSGGYDYSGGTYDDSSGGYDYSGDTYDYSSGGYDYSGDTYGNSSNGYDYSGGSYDDNAGTEYNWDGGYDAYNSYNAYDYDTSWQ